MNLLPTNPVPTVLVLSKSQSLMTELFGDKKNEASEITSSASKPAIELIESYETQGSYAALTAQRQQILAPFAPTVPIPSAPSSSLPYHSTGFIAQASFYDDNVQAPDIPFEAMMNLALPPQVATPYQQSSYSYPQIQGDHPSHSFCPTQRPTAYHCQPLSYHSSMLSSIPLQMATPPPSDFFSRVREQNNNELLLDLPPDFFSVAPTNFTQDSTLHHDFSTSRFISPTPSNGTTDSSGTKSSSTSYPRERARRPRYVPRISRTELSLVQGVLCDVIFRCEWESCGTVYQLEGNTNAEETAFQNRVLKHLSEHAFHSSKGPDATRLQCQWGDCHRQMSTTTKERGMVRHLQSHIAAWYYFCPNLRCSHTSSRRVLKSHSSFCAFSKISVAGNPTKQSRKTKACR